jgi:acyl-CoA synthetase (AMP-forming)/AMP-acid ligase II
MILDFFLQKMNGFCRAEALATSSGVIHYDELLSSYEESVSWLNKHQIPSGKVISFDCEYTLHSISLFLALAANRNILVPLSNESKAQHDDFQHIAECEYSISLSNDQKTFKATGRMSTNPFYTALRERHSAGLVLFSSGSTGKSKGIVHDLFLLMEKFRTLRKQHRMLIFLQLDHIGGVNSLLYNLVNGGLTILPEDRSPTHVCRCIERHKADLLPTSPTFLHLMLLSKAYEQFDLSSLKLITYGTEPMPQSTLERCTKALPNVQMQQTYGLSELGILRTQSKKSDSLWVKIGGAEFETKIIDGRLWVRSESSMLGYLNAPNPFDSDGYFDTGDRVECDGDWLRILGRESEIINVGGLKVYPAEVENVLLEMDNVEDVVVFGEDHNFMGKIVAAKVKLNQPESLRDFKGRMLAFCKQRLQQYKIPGKIFFCEEAMHNQRFKRMRRLRNNCQ